MDQIHIKNLRIHAYHGVLASEKEQGQFFEIDLVAIRHFHDFVDADDYQKATCYASLCDDMVAFATKEKYNLIETLAHRLALYLLRKNPPLEAVTLTIRKPSAPIIHALDYVAVEIFRSRDDVEGDSDYDHKGNEDEA